MSISGSGTSWELFDLHVSHADSGAPNVLAHDESDFAAIPILRSRLSAKPHVIVTSKEDFSGLANETIANLSNSVSNVRDSASGLFGNSSDAPTVAKLNDVIARCLKRRASDIHLEPREQSLHCRARIDGVLTLVEEIPKAKIAELLSRLKIMSGLDIAEKRRPQDGRIRFDYEDRKVDIRVSIIPTEFGEKAVLRLLDKSTLCLTLDAIGFDDQELQVFKEKISLPNGVILVTGPTGSGKTTTLYAALSHLKSAELNISTVEDPIEYNLAGINQTQVKPDIGVSFAQMLRALLRQDPNVIMVGEIRDPETLDMAIRASLTGHLVFSTLHTNDAAATITRLLNMGADPFVLASTLKLVVAQRLVRRICDQCGIVGADEANRAAACRIGLDSQDAVLRFGRGCPVCNHTGFRGRLPVFEMLPITSLIAEAIGKSSPDSEIRSLAVNQGFGSLLENARRLVLIGLTTPSEVLREVHA